MSNQKKHIILVDDHRRVHQVISEMLEFYDDIELIAQGSNGQEAIDLCALYQPDLILMDVVMPELDGVEATKHIMAKYPDMKILALSSFEDPDAVRSMMEHGAVGYILKTASTTKLYHTIRSAIDGQVILSPQVMKTFVNTQPSVLEESLTSRELEVLVLLATGKTNSEIASELMISPSTVKFHQSNLLSKLDVDTRAEALVIAAKNNLI